MTKKSGIRMTLLLVGVVTAFLIFIRLCHHLPPGFLSRSVPLSQVHFGDAIRVIKS